MKLVFHRVVDFSISKGLANDTLVQVSYYFNKSLS